jgi:RNA polymerase sigma-70 factor, ECF subfamily
LETAEPDIDGERAWRERALREAILAGDEAAWRAVYERHFDPLRAWIRFRAGGDAERTDEAVGECWVVAVRRIRDFDPARGTLDGWLRGIAANVLRNQGRKLALRRRRERPAGDGTPEARAPDAGGREEEAEAIRVALAQIPEHYRTALREKYQEGLGVDAMAARRGETAKAVESLLSRARAAFRAAFERLDEEA